jgi:hypothetical protein
LKSIKIRIEAFDSEAVIDANTLEILNLRTHMDVFLRVVQKSGSKFTIKYKYNLSLNMRENLRNMFATAGLKEANFKILDGDKFLDRNKEFDAIYEIGKDIYWYAFESLGAPKKWKRFKTHYEYSTWSNSGNSSDGVVYIPTKSLTVAGFVSYSAKDDPDYELKYRLQIDGVTVEE